MFSYTKLYYREDVKKVGRGWEGKEFIHILHKIKAFNIYPDNNRKRFLVHSVNDIKTTRSDIDVYLSVG